MQRILIITENAKAAAPWQHELIRAGYPVQSVTPGRQELIEAFSPRPPEVFILDGTSARLTPKQFRELLDVECPNHESCLIWFVTEELAARLDPSAGIDDFIVLPSSAHELLARVRLLLWKTHRINADDLILAGKLVIDQANYCVALDGRSLELTFKEYELLRFLVSHRGRVFTREALLNQVWGYDYYGGTRTVDVHIRRIRAKLGPEHEDLVETIRNVGYRFNA
ncbi:MAG TPA: response regulator transcription factor [Armatimonadota bacterium]|nr:response regulator transcription factor [Armatimonadota bacterium]